jgi:pyrrolysine biosynthesis protein PylD
VTRLIESDVRSLTAHLVEVEAALVRLTGCDLVALGARACGVSEGAARDALAYASAVAVPITTGEGLIPGFAECVAAICAHLGCHARVTAATDVAGFAETLSFGDDLVFAADDRKFLAFDFARRTVADDDPCTAWAYAAALDRAAGPDGVAGKPVLVIGLGPVGTAAAARLVELGAEVFVTELDDSRLESAAGELEVTPVPLADGLASCRLVLDATPSPDLIGADWVRAGGVVSSPGLPPGVTPAAAEALGDRLVHEPLALGVAAMAVQALAAPAP